MFEELLPNLSSDPQVQALWKDFLSTLGTPGGLADQSLEPLVRTLGDEAVLSGLSRIAETLPGTCETDLLRLALRVSGRIRRELEQEVNRLRDTLRELATAIMRMWKDVLCP